MDFYMKVFQNTETLPVLLMNDLWSREQKWYRVSTAFFLTSRRTEIAISASQAISRGLLAGRRIGTEVAREENLCDLKTADHTVLSEGCESRNNHRYAVVVQDLATHWVQSYPCKTKLHNKPREACKSSWSPIGILESFTLTIPWNLAKLVKISPGIIARLHHIDQKQMGLPRERCAE